MRMFHHSIPRALLAAAVLFPASVHAQRPRGAERPVTEAPSNQAVHLRFLGRTWDDVLKSVAHETGQTLVMPEVPSGRITRYDHGSYTPAEGIRILNQELEPTGFQIMSKGDYLIVLRDDRFRPQYARPVVNRDPQAGRANSPINSPVNVPAENSATAVVPTGLAVPPQEFDEREFHEPRPLPGQSSQDTHQNANQTAQWSARNPHPTIEPIRPGASTQVELARPLKPAAAAAPTQALVIEPNHVTAVELSRKLYKAYGKQARLVQQGPLGLPAFSVQLPSIPHSSHATAAANGRPSSQQLPVEHALQREITVGIDQDNNQLVLVAGEQEQSALVDVLESLDIDPRTVRRGEPLSPVLMFAAPEVHQTVTRNLPDILAQVRESDPQPPKRGTNGLQQNADPAFLPPNPATANGENGNMAGQQPAPADLNAILDRLRGDVSIESLNDLGLLILRGNESDVSGVMEIIRAIETLSAGTTPEIHLRHLEHISSEALTTLLNSVYESVQTIDRRASRANRRANFVPVVQPNSLLIIAPSIDLESILALIDELDQPTDPRSQVKLFRLKNSTATGAVTLLEEFYEERGGLGTRLRISADERTNTLVVQATPQDLKEIAIVIRDLDQDESHAVSRLQLFPLKNAVAEELSEFINTAISEALNPRAATGLGGQQQQTGLNQPKSFVLEFLAGSGSQSELIRSGLLTDIRVSADPRSNSLAVIAPERSLPLFAALIESLDRPSTAVAEVKVFTLTYADANAALALLQELFDQTGTESPVGVNLAGAADSGSTLLPIRFSVDVRSNSILAIGGSDALTIVEAILLRLDNESPRKRINTVVKLKNSPPTEVAAAINQFLESQRELASIDPDLVSAFEQLEREVIVVAEPLSNNLLISATPEYYSEVIRIATQLDAAPAQVIIQALLVEVQLDNLDEFGVELGFQDSVLFNRSLIENLQTITNTTTNQNIQTTTQQIISQEGAPGFLFNNPSLFPNLGNNISPAANPSAVGTQGLANFGVGRVNGDLGYGGLVLSASSESVSVLVRALAQQRNVQVLSRPQIRTLDSQLAQIQVGQVVPIVNGVNITGTGVANPNIEYDEAGIILSVTPRINSDGQIVMEVVAERSAYRSGGVPIFTDATTGSTITSPIKDISVARATVGVADGQTIVLGGMISETDSATTRKVPWLGDIPVLGRLFRYDSATNVRSELLIFLTPRILYGDCDNEMIKEVEAGRIHFFREEAEEIHGPLFSVPTGDMFLPEEVIPEDSQYLLDDNLQIAPLPLPADGLPPRNQELPLTPPALPNDAGIPKTIVPDGSLKPMSHESPGTASVDKDEAKPTATKRKGVTRVFR